MPVDTNKNELEVNLIGNNLTLDTRKVTYNSERLSDNLDYKGIDKESVNFIKNASKTVMRAKNKLSDSDRKEFVYNIVRLESETRQSIDAVKTVESMYNIHPEQYHKDALNALKPPSFNSINRGDEIIVNGKKYVVEEKYTDYGEENSLEIKSTDDEYEVISYKNGVSLDDLDNPVNIQLK